MSLIISCSRFLLCQRQGQGPRQDGNFTSKNKILSSRGTERKKKSNRKWHLSQHPQPRHRPELNSNANEVNSFKKSQKYVPVHTCRTLPYLTLSIPSPSPSSPLPPPFLYRLNPPPPIRLPALEKNTSHTHALTLLTPPPPELRTRLGKHQQIQPQPRSRHHSGQRVFFGRGTMEYL